MLHVRVTLARAAGVVLDVLSAFGDTLETHIHKRAARGTTLRALVAPWPEDGALLRVRCFVVHTFPLADGSHGVPATRSYGDVMLDVRTAVETGIIDMASIPFGDLLAGHFDATESMGTVRAEPLARDAAVPAVSPGWEVRTRAAPKFVPCGEPDTPLVEAVRRLNFARIHEITHAHTLQIHSAALPMLDTAIGNNEKTCHYAYMAGSLLVAAGEEPDKARAVFPMVLMGVFPSPRVTYPALDTIASWLFARSGLSRTDAVQGLRARDDRGVRVIMGLIGLTAGGPYAPDTRADEGPGVERYCAVMDDYCVGGAGAANTPGADCEDDALAMQISRLFKCADPAVLSPEAAAVREFLMGYCVGIAGTGATAASASGGRGSEKQSFHSVAVFVPWGRLRDALDAVLESGQLREIFDVEYAMRLSGLAAANAAAWPTERGDIVATEGTAQLSWFRRKGSPRDALARARAEMADKLRSVRGILPMDSGNDGRLFYRSHHTLVCRVDLGDALALALALVRRPAGDTRARFTAGIPTESFAMDDGPEEMGAFPLVVVDEELGCDLSAAAALIFPRPPPLATTSAQVFPELPGPVLPVSLGRVGAGCDGEPGRSVFEPWFLDLDRDVQRVGLEMVLVDVELSGFKLREALVYPSSRGLSGSRSS